MLKEQNLWPARGLKLEYIEPKCFNYQIAVDWKICVKKYKCDLYKAFK